MRVTGNEAFPSGSGARPGVRTVRLATGAYVVSFVRDGMPSRRSLREELDQLAGAEDLVLNLDGLVLAEATEVAASAREFSRQAPASVVALVCEQPEILAALRGLDLEGVILEPSLDEAFHRVLGHAWLRFPLTDS
jgi:hypothetical protein